MEKKVIVITLFRILILSIQLNPVFHFQASFLIYNSTWGTTKQTQICDTPNCETVTWELRIYIYTWDKANAVSIIQLCHRQYLEYLFTLFNIKILSWRKQVYESWLKLMPLCKWIYIYSHNFTSITTVGSFVFYLQWTLTVLWT